MKIKIDFITNSSSASFVILKEHLSVEQIILILNHTEVAMMLDKDQGRERYYDKWSLSEDDEKISGYTSMDNFDMYTFLIEDLKIDESIIEFDHS